MRAFGIVMFLIGCALGFGGLVGLSQIDSSGRITCSPSGTQAAPQTICFQDADGDANLALKKAAGGVVLAVVGAGFIAGGLAAAGAAGRPGPSRSVAPPVGYAGAGYGGGQPGEPQPGPYGTPGQQSPPPYGQNR